MTTQCVRGEVELRVISMPSRVEEAPFPLCFTPGACRTLLDTVGALPPETGAKGFGPVEKMGIDMVEFDEVGSRNASSAVYSPDTGWGNERVTYWLNRPDAEMKLWTGDIHSHPGGWGFPSSRAGEGLGDLGYVEEVFRQNETMQYFCLPILTGVGTAGPVTLSPWVISRDAPERPLYAPLRICPAEEFPKRVFNPAWTADARPAPPLDTTDLSARLGTPVQVVFRAKSAEVLLEVNRTGLTLLVWLPPRFPAEAPLVWFQVEGTAPQSVPVRWRAGANKSPEERLAHLCLRASAFLRRTF